MDSSNTGPCPECRQPIDLDARVCPHCRRSVLADVVLEGSVRDGRNRYRASRALLVLGEGIPTLSALQATLASGRGAVAYGVSPAVAERAAGIVRDAGGQAVVRPAGEQVDEEEGTARPGLKKVGIASAAVVAAAVIAALLLRGTSTPSTAAGTPEGPAPVELSPEEVAVRGLPATVALSCGEQSGSGFFVTQDLLITNSHVICRDRPSVNVRFSDGRESQGMVERTDEGLDLAVVRAPGLQAEPLALGDAGALRLGQRLTMLGSPLGLEFTVHECGVSNLERHDLGLAFVQIDAAVNPGNSGGPLVDRTGRVVGVVTLKAAGGEGIGFAVPINYAFSVQNALLDGYSKTHTRGFAQMVARAEGASRQEAEKLQATGQRPGLVAAVVKGPVLMARIIWPSAEPPWVQNFSFTLVEGEEPFCSMTGEVSEWRMMESQGDSEVLDPRGKHWLESHGFSADVYEGVAAMRWEHCPADRLGGVVYLEMENADDDARRLRFQ